MKRTRIIGLCLVAAFMIGAVAAASATATPPEYGRCLKQSGGAYKNGGCTIPSVPGEEKYEWFPGPGPKNKFTSTLKAETLATLETTSGVKVVCKGETNSGEYTGTKTISNLQITFTGCEVNGVPCNTAGAKTGEVVAQPLEAALAFAIFNKKGKREGTGVGRATFPVVGEVMIEMECGGAPVVVRGTVLVFVGKNAMKLKSTLKYKAIKGEQKPERYENEAKENELGIIETSVGGEAFSQTGLTAEIVQTNEEKIEINMVV
jgi:hypothetical protein